jgi:hypothetical protein
VTGALISFDRVPHGTLRLYCDPMIGFLLLFILIAYAAFMVRVWEFAILAMPLFVAAYVISRFWRDRIHLEKPRD